MKHPELISLYFLLALDLLVIAAIVALTVGEKSPVYVATAIICIIVCIITAIRMIITSIKRLSSRDS